GAALRRFLDAQRLIHLPTRLDRLEVLEHQALRGRAAFDASLNQLLHEQLVLRRLDDLAALERIDLLEELVEERVVSDLDGLCMPVDALRIGLVPRQEWSAWAAPLFWRCLGQNTHSYTTGVLWRPAGVLLARALQWPYTSKWLIGLTFNA